jgi:Rhodopirellula transposase DDE domain
MEYETAGDPKTGLKWTRKATRKIARALQQEDIMVSAKSVARILKKMGYSLRANRKKLALSANGSKHERKKRDLQFCHIRSTRECFARQGEPSVSVDTKKKELIGNFKNPGRVWRDRHRDVADHDFPSYAKAKISPYGIYDTQANTGMVCVGISHDTPAFAADSILDWWEHHGAQQYPNAKKILILADNGGSNRPTSVPFKYHLWNSLCLRYGLTVTICHYPTGASKWNPIEHRLFSEISKNWAGEPLVSLQTTLNFIRKTKTDSGLRVSARLNRKHYQCKEKIPKQQAARIIVERDPVFPDLNYTLLPPK